MEMPHYVQVMPVCAGTESDLSISFIADVNRFPCYNNMPSFRWLMFATKPS